ncbi:MAG: GyrI-like domain-containing protein [Ferruginibacter sp.]
MITPPITEKRNELPYLSIHRRVNKKDIPAVLPPLIGEVMTFIREKNIAGNFTPFFLYRSMDDQYNFETEVGVLVNDDAEGNSNIIKGAFPSGNYATTIYSGDYSTLMEAHSAVESFILKNGLKEKQQKSGNLIEWGGRIEFYLTDPEMEPDTEKWKTEVAFLLED